MSSFSTQPRVVCSTYWFQLRANDAPRSIRERLGRILRDLAQSVDGLHSIGVELNSIPPISQQQRKDCIRMGLDAMHRGLDSEARSAAIELILQNQFSELYDEELFTPGDQSPK